MITPIKEMLGPDNPELGYHWNSSSPVWQPGGWSKTIPDLIRDQLKDIIKYRIVEADNVDAAMYVGECILKAPFRLAMVCLMALSLLFVYVPLWYLGAGMRKVLRRVV